MRKIVIAPYAFHKGLISFFQKKDPFYDVKILSKEEIFSEYFGKLDNDGIANLLANEELDINKVREICRYIPYAINDDDNIKVHALYLYNKDLKGKGLLKTNEYFPYLLKDKEIEIIGYSKDDKELCNILDDLNLTYSFNYGFGNPKSHKVTKYKSLLLETLDLMNNVCDQIKNGKNPKDIYIYTNNQDIITYLKQFHSSFNLPINFNDSISLASTNIGKNLLAEIDSCKAFDEIIEWIGKNVEDTFSNDLIRLINENIFDFLTDSELKDFIKSAIEGFKIATEKYDNAVSVITKPIFIEDATIFVPGFIQGSFPSVYKDNEYISDIEKEIIGVNSSAIKTKISYWENMEFFDSNNEFVFSYSNEHLSNSYSVSPIAIFNNYLINDNKCPERIYSDEYRVFLQTISLDLFNVFKEKTSEYYALKDFDLDYKNYDNSYSQVSHFNSDSNLEHSYTKLTEFYECPFNYYLEEVLNVNKDDYGLPATIGNICHDIFQHMFDLDFDFDVAFDKNLHSHDLNALEILIVDALRGQVKKAVTEFLRHRSNYMTTSYVFTETKSVVNLDDHTKLVGRIDAAYILDKEYVVIIDYKSGNDKVDINNIDYGVSLQLPIYAYLSRNDKRFSSFKIGGLYLQKFIEKHYSYEVKGDAFVKPVLKLEGLSNIDEDFLKKFDFSFRDNGKSQYINGVALTKQGKLSSRGNKLMSENELNALADKAESLVKEADKRIRNNEFNIFPLKKKTSIDACQYCKNRDICYVRSKQFNVIESEDNE